MKTKITFWFSLIVIFFQPGSIRAQVPACDSLVPTFNIDFTGITADSMWISPNVVKAGYCCGAGAPTRCIDFIILADVNTVGLKIEIYSGAVPNGALFYQLDCGPLFNFADTCPVTVPGIHYLTYCKPGNSINSYRVTAITADISGKVFNDVNSNCIYDAGDVALQGIPVDHLFNNTVV